MVPTLPVSGNFRACELRPPSRYSNTLVSSCRPVHSLKPAACRKPSSSTNRKLPTGSLGLRICTPSLTIFTYADAGGRLFHVEQDEFRRGGKGDADIGNHLAGVSHRRRIGLKVAFDEKRVPIACSRRCAADHQSLHEALKVCLDALP